MRWASFPSQHEPVKSGIAYHWDAVRPQFRSLHELCEEHYETLTENIDAIAQRVWMSEGYPVGTADGFLKYTSIKDWEVGQILPPFAYD